VVADPRGRLLLQAPIFEPALLPVSLDLDEITRARAETPLLSDLQTRLPHLLESLAERRADGQAVGRTDGRTVGRSDGEPVRPSARPPESSADPLAIDPELTRRWLVEFIRDEIIRRRKFTNVVLGLSGGVDSAVVAFLAYDPPACFGS
jgi:hypothetical protein